MEKGSANLYRWDGYLFFQKSKPLKKIFTKKASLCSGSQPLRTAEGSLVTGADGMGGKISIAAEGHSGPKMPMQLFAFLWHACFRLSKHWIALNLMWLAFEDKAESPREDVAILIAVELFRIDYT